jgi:hypothetical protein
MKQIILNNQDRIYLLTLAKELDEAEHYRTGYQGEDERIVRMSTTLAAQISQRLRKIAELPGQVLVDEAWGALAWLEGTVELSDKARAFKAKKLREVLEEFE